MSYKTAFLTCKQSHCIPNRDYILMISLMFAASDWLTFYNVIDSQLLAFQPVYNYSNSVCSMSGTDSNSKVTVNPAAVNNIAIPLIGRYMFVISK